MRRFSLTSKGNAERQSWIRRVGRGEANFTFVSIVGEQFLKHCSNGRSHARVVQLNPAGTRILWETGGMSLTGAYLTEGKTTLTLLRSAKSPPELCFSVCGLERTLDLECFSTEQYEFWINGLKQLLGQTPDAGTHMSQVRRRSSLWQDLNDATDARTGRAMSVPVAMQDRIRGHGFTDSPMASPFSQPRRRRSSAQSTSSNGSAPVVHIRRQSDFSQGSTPPLIPPPRVGKQRSSTPAPLVPDLLTFPDENSREEVSEDWDGVEWSWGKG